MRAGLPAMLAFACRSVMRKMLCSSLERPTRYIPVVIENIFFVEVTYHVLPLKEWLPVLALTTVTNRERDIILQPKLHFLLACDKPA